MFKKLLVTSLVAGSALALSACNDNGDGDGYGSLSLHVTDAPVDSATAVVVTFTGVEIKHADETGPEVFTFDTPRSINLLDLQGSASEALFEDELVPAGDYDWIRLQVNAERGVVDSWIEFEDGSQHSLWVPSGSQSGLKLVRGFVVPVGGSADFTIDFDLRKSVVDPQGQFTDYLLKPALRLIDNATAGAIAGTVSNALVTTECTPAVYLFEDAGTTADDVDGNETDPLTSANPALDDASGEYVYEIGFVAPGEYTLAFTCEADNDDPEMDDAISFIQSQDVTVVADETATADFD